MKAPEAELGKSMTSVGSITPNASKVRSESLISVLVLGFWAVSAVLEVYEFMVDIIDNANNDQNQ